MLVTNRSSPTSWHLAPIASVSAFQPSQSSSAMPSSIETIGIARDEVGEVLGHAGAVERLALALHVVLAVLEELGRGAIERQHDVLARLVAGLLDRLHDEAERLVGAS